MKSDVSRLAMEQGEIREMKYEDKSDLYNDIKPAVDDFVLYGGREYR